MDCRGRKDQTAPARPAAARRRGSAAPDGVNASRGTATAARDPGTAAQGSGDASWGTATAARRRGSSARGAGDASWGTSTAARRRGSAAPDGGDASWGTATAARDPGTAAQGSVDASWGTATAARRRGSSARGAGDASWGTSAATWGPGTAAQDTVNASRGTAGAARRRGSATRDAGNASWGTSTAARGPGGTAQDGVDASWGTSTVARDPGGAARDDVNASRGTSTTARDPGTAARDGVNASRGTSAAARDPGTAARGGVDASRGTSTAARGMATTARDEANASRGTSAAARDPGGAARDGVDASRGTSTAGQGMGTAARDDVNASRGTAGAARDGASASRSRVAAGAPQASGSAASRESWGAPGPRTLGPCPRARLRTVLESLSLCRAARGVASERVNRLCDLLLRDLPAWDPAFRHLRKLGAGSYYEHLKISAPNEFDIMLKLPLPRVKLEEVDSSGAFYRVKFKRIPRENPLNNFLEDNETLSASKILSKFRDLIKKEVKNINDMDIVVERKKPGSPAVTLLIRSPTEISVDLILTLELRSSWPLSTRNGLNIEKWLGNKVKQELKYEPVYLVPKHAKEGRIFRAETWRLSFSHIEKKILSNHGHSKTCCESNGVKCCRKECLKLMKHLLEKLKKKFEAQTVLDKFCSYHIKTAFLNLCAIQPEDDQWQLSDLERCFDNCIVYFLQCLRKRQLIHFFISTYNLFSPDQIAKTSIECLIKEIEFERNNMFPVFDD